VFAISKNHGVPKRSITPASFDAILGELGDDPAIGHPSRSTPSSPENQTMNRHSYEADAHRLSSVTRELAMISSNDGKSVAISVSKV
jgi:hypothetical protein